MRKILSLLAVLVLSSVLVFAQTRSVSGTVTDEKGDPIPYASIVVKGIAKGVTADADGKFVLSNIATGAQVVVSAQGHQEQTITVGSQSLLSVSLLKSSGSTLSEVVVTGAFNIKRSQRAVAYNAQNVNAEQLNTIRQTNVTNALSGKVAGLQVLGQSSVKLGADNDQRLGGATTLGGGGVIYVVDGTIVSASDINPDDVEDVTVYSGVAATALFGDR
ncbi:MAG: carboxypeptidase-like regulatory domain-containing protein, partial [Flavitalea sp.]